MIVLIAWVDVIFILGKEGNGRGGEGEREGREKGEGGRGWMRNGGEGD